MTSSDGKELWVGLRVIWRHTPRGGYGYTIKVPATVTWCRNKRLGLVLDNGRKVWTTPDKVVSPGDMKHIRPACEAT